MRLLITVILITAIILIVLTPLTYAHRLYLKVINITEYKGRIIVKARAYFGGFGGASGTPIYVYGPDCKSALCPPKCPIYARYTTDERGFVKVVVPKGRWVIAAIADPAHVACVVITPELKTREEFVITPLIDVLGLPEYVGALIGLAIFIVIWLITRGLTRRHVGGESRS